MTIHTPRPRRPTALDAALGGALLLTLLPWGGRHLALLDLAAQFLLQGMLATAAVVVAALLRRRLRHAMAGAACLVIQLGIVHPGGVLPQPTAAQAAQGPGLRLLVFNVWIDNRRPAELLRYVAEQRPDALVLVEVFGAWREIVDILQAEYPQRLDCLDLPGCDVVILAKQPLLDGIATRDPATGTPLVGGRLQVGGGAVTILGTHLIRPIGVGTLADQLAQAQWLATRLADMPGPFVLTGDLNAVGWGRLVTALAADTGLRPLPTLTGTYPSPLPWPLRIPIDHALVSPELAGAIRRTGPHLGSDHRPLIIDLSPPRAPA